MVAGVNASSLALEFVSVLDGLGASAPLSTESSLFDGRSRALQSALHVFVCGHPRMCKIPEHIVPIARLVNEATVSEALTYWMLCLICEEWCQCSLNTIA